MATKINLKRNSPPSQDLHKVVAQLWKTAHDFRASATAHVPTEPSGNGSESPFTSPKTETCKNPSNLIKKWAKDLNRLFPKKTYQWPRGT